LCPQMRPGANMSAVPLSPALRSSCPAVKGEAGDMSRLDMVPKHREDRL
jgi:hypothetical protein